MEVLVVLITLAVITVVGILIFLGVRAIFEFIVDHSILKIIGIALFILALASDMVGQWVLLIVGGILLVKSVIYGIGYISFKIFPSHSYSDPMTLYPKRCNENDEEEYEIIDFDTYEDMFGNKYRYDRINDELIDRNYQRTKVSKVYEHDLKLTDSKGNPYDRIN